jgi:hypothetical protein
VRAQRGKGRLRVPDDSDVRLEHPADLPRLDVDLDEPAALPVGLEVAQPRPDGQHEVARQQCGLGPVLRRLGGVRDEPGCAGEQGVVLGERASGHGRDLDRNLQVLGELAQLVRGARADHPGPGEDDRASGLEQQLHCGVDRLLPRPGHVDGQRGVERGVVGAPAALEVGREVDQHGSGAAGAGEAERLAENPRRPRRLVEPHGPLGDGPGDLCDVHGPVHRLPGDADDRDGVGERRGEARDHVGAGEAGGPDRHSDLAGGSCPPVGGVRAALRVPHRDVLHAALPQRGVEGEERRVGDAEHGVGALRREHGSNGLHTGDPLSAGGSHAVEALPEMFSSTFSSTEWSSEP